MVDDYSLVSGKDISQLKKSVEDLKKVQEEKAAGATKGLLDSMDKLTKTMSTMTLLFQQAGEGMAQEDVDQESIKRHLKPIEERLDQLLEENKKIAKGIVAIADMLKEEEPVPPKAQQRQMQSQPQPIPSPFDDHPMPFLDASMPRMKDMPSLDDIPPPPIFDSKPMPPPPPTQKKGFFA
ncbi:hypothetical protein HZB02_00415 [Candidatus Woesearchaeota archaeon]|nr:hypothetical protein [Candidatus Woesearchaeota archaeon]